jgi:hypothetical protein
VRCPTRSPERWPPTQSARGTHPTTDLPRNAEDAAGVTDPLSGLAQLRPSMSRNAQEGRATETVLLRHRGMAQPYGPPGRRSCRLPVRLPHDLANMVQRGRSGNCRQPCTRTKVPSHDRKAAPGAADERAYRGSPVPVTCAEGAPAAHWAARPWRCRRKARASCKKRTESFQTLRDALADARRRGPVNGSLLGLV